MSFQINTTEQLMQEIKKSIDEIVEGREETQKSGADIDHIKTFNIVLAEDIMDLIKKCDPKFITQWITGYNREVSL